MLTKMWMTNIDIEYHHKKGRAIAGAPLGVATSGFFKD